MHPQIRIGNFIICENDTTTRIDNFILEKSDSTANKMLRVIRKHVKSVIISPNSRGDIME